MTKQELERLVDDYLDKHRKAVEAGNRRFVVRREFGSQKDKDVALDAFCIAHNERAAAFRALAASRGRTPVGAIMKRSVCVCRGVDTCMGCTRPVSK